MATTVTLDATSTTTTESSVQTVLVTASECVAYKAACEAVGATECSGGTWAIGCSAGLTVANPEFAYPAGICARCLCTKKNATNNQTSVTQLLDDIPCLATSTATNFTVAVSGSSPENSTVPLNNNNNNNGSSSNSLTLPLTLSLALVAVIAAAAAVYFYMKRKNRRYEHERRIPSPPGLNEPSDSATTLVAKKSAATPPVATAPITISRKPFLMSMWTATTTTTTNESKADDGSRLNTKTTTVTVEAYPSSSLQKRPHLMINSTPPGPPSPATTKNTIKESSDDSTILNQQLQASPTPPGQVHHTPYIPSDSFLTPKTNGATITAVAVNRSWSLEEQWQWEQYQAAVQWHQWQLAQKEWQASQREYYMAKEEERKNKIAASGGVGNGAEDDDRMPEDGKIQQQRKRGFSKGGFLGLNYRPSPLRVVSVDGDSTLSSRRAESIISRDGSLISRTLSSNGAYGTLGVGGGNTTNRQSIDNFTNPLFNTGTSFGESFANSISRTTSRRSVGSSTKSTVASIIIATSPEWSAPLDLIQVGSPRSTMTNNNNRSRSRISNAHKSTIEIETGSVDASGALTSTYVTSSTFALGEDVSVITMTSVGDDGPLTTQILSSMPVIVQDSAAAAAVAVVTNSSSNATLNLPASPTTSAFGNQAYDGRSPSPDFRVTSSSSRKSSSKSYGSVTETIPPLPTAVNTAITAGGKFFEEPSAISEHPQQETKLTATAVAADLVDDDGQIKYPVRVAYVPEREDELRLDVDDEVVVWHILEDGMCEGFCVGRRERGFFPVKVVL